MILSGEIYLSYFKILGSRREHNRRASAPHVAKISSCYVSDCSSAHVSSSPDITIHCEDFNLPSSESRSNYSRWYNTGGSSKSIHDRWIAAIDR